MRLHWKRILAGFLSVALMNYSIAATENISYFHNEASGSPVVATDASGRVLWKESYRPYGEQVQKPAATNNVEWFHGKPFDDSSGLSYFGVRYYDPSLGRFMGVDPAPVSLGDLQSINRYAYGSNNPLINTDVDGRFSVALYLIVVAASLVIVGGQIRQNPEMQRQISEGLQRGFRGIFNQDGSDPPVVNKGDGGSLTASASPPPPEDPENRGGNNTGLTRSQRTDIRTIDNVIENNAKPHDFAGVRNEIAGRATGFDHITEMRQSVVSLRRAINGLEGSLRNPKLSDSVRNEITSALNRGRATLTEMQKALGGQ